MKKKLLIMVLVLGVFLLPVSNVFAYSGGLLGGKPVTIGQTQSGSQGGTTLLFTDDDESTFATVEANGLNDFVWVDLPKAKRLTSYKLNAEVGANLTLYLFRADLSTSGTVTNIPLKKDGTLTNIDFNGVSKVAIKNNGTVNYKIFEFDVFGVDADIDLLGTSLISRGSDIDNFANYANAVNDGDILTDYPLGAKDSTADVMWKKFDNPVTIDVYRLKAEKIGVQLAFYTSQGALITSITSPTIANERTTISPVENVGYVALINTLTGGLYVQEIDVYNSIPPDGSVQGLSETHTDISASLSWVNPTLPNFTGTKIKKNGVEVATLANTTNSYNVTGLTANTAYTFEVTPTYSDGTTAISKSVTFTTDVEPLDITAPSNISNVNVAITDAVASFMYGLPIDTDFSHLKIYRDGVLKETNFTGTSYDDFSLVQNTTYVYKFVSVDLSGNESNGYVQSVTTAVTVDNTAPVSPIGVEVTNGGSSGSVKWTMSNEADVKGYNLYIDGVKHNTSLILANTYVIPNLVNDQNYLITVTSVDTSDNESAPSVAQTLTPTAEGMPLFEAKYDLKDVADGTSQWFGSMWLILAFSVGIPLSFIIARRVKGLLIA